jgi:hypothetical protein
MSEVILNGPRIVAIARELVSRTMPQHVRMNLKGQARLLTRPLHQPIEPIGSYVQLLVHQPQIEQLTSGGLMRPHRQ